MTTTTASKLFAAGYRDLVSVVPPGAKMSSRSEIPDGSDPAKPDQRGKAPGKYDGNRGDWAGYNWREFKPLAAHIELWEKAGANIGLHARCFPAIDIDCLDETLVYQVHMIARNILGDAPLRIGRAPKALLVYTTGEPFTRMRLHLTRGDEKGLIEILGDGQQYLVAGTHPGTMKPYEWIGKPLHAWDPLNDLTPIDAAACERFLEEVELICGLDGWETRREGKARILSEGGAVQEELAAPSFEACQAAVLALPNTDAMFPSRDAMNEVGYAIKASVGEEGLPLFLEWASRWRGPNGEENDPEYVAHEWDRMVPPFRIGWEWLVGKARQLGGYNDAGDDFEALAPMPSDSEFDVLPAPPGGSAPPSSPGSGGTGGDDKDPPPPKYSDYAVAHRFCRTFGDQLRYVEALGGWVHYSRKAGTWERDETFKAEQAMQRVCASYAKEANEDANLGGKERKSIVMGLTRAATFSNGLRVARSRKPFAGLTAQDFDKDTLLLNTPEGLIDLRDGTSKEHSPDSLVTRTTHAAPVAGEPVRWLQFLREALGDDPELISYVQTLCGYWLTAETNEQQLTFVWGPGGNGKGVFANTIAWIMGDYAMRTPSTTFASVRNEAHPEAMARLRGARLVLTTELQEGLAWDEAKVKTATGGDVITARFMNQGSFDYHPQFKLLFLGNHKPRIRNLGPAWRRRIHLVPMINTPAVVNKHLEQELREEAGQILAWAIEGCTRWRAEGLKIPAAVRAATAEYFNEEDIVGQFLEENCDTSDHKAFTASATLWNVWRRWTQERGEPERTQTWLSRQLGQRPGMEAALHKVMRVRGFFGVQLLTDDFPVVEPGKEPAKST